jgi:aminopeptidase YwaD
LEPFLLEVAAANGHALRCVRPLMMNSDHGNFALAGIPAFRLVAGYDDPLANARYVLTPADTRDKVARAELATAAELSAAVIMAACDAAEAEARGWRE